MAKATLDAAFLIIGNEILSGRTQETNLAKLARTLRARGIKLVEAQVVRDECAAVVTAVNDLRARYRYLFTSGGIGPTHDDITTACIAAAFEVPVIRHAEAETQLREFYLATDRKPNVARLSMADVPEGAELVYCDLSPAPGFRVDNVYVFAGVPEIFVAMLEAVRKELEQGPAMNSRTIVVLSGESEVAAELEAVQDQFMDLELGSYPQTKDGRYFVELVISGTDSAQLDTALAQLTKSLDALQLSWHELD